MYHSIFFTIIVHNFSSKCMGIDLLGEEELEGLPPLRTAWCKRACATALTPTLTLQLDSLSWHVFCQLFLRDVWIASER